MSICICVLSGPGQHQKKMASPPSSSSSPDAVGVGGGDGSDAASGGGSAGIRYKHFAKIIDPEYKLEKRQKYLFALQGFFFILFSLLNKHIHH